MDFKNSCWNALSLLVIQTALASAADPTWVRPRDPAGEERYIPAAPLLEESTEPADVLENGESGSTDLDARSGGPATYFVSNSTEEESQDALLVSEEEMCVSDESSYNESDVSQDGLICGQMGDWMSSMACQKSPWFVGTEMSFVSINARTGGRISLSQSDTTAPGVATISILDGNGINGRGYAPRLWVGRRLGENWAVQARYWNLNRSVARAPDQLVPATGTNFATITETDRMNASTFDIEAVRSFRPGDWKIDAFVGGRHAAFGVDSQIQDFGVFTTGNFTNLLLANGCSFNGSGVTYGLSVRHHIGQTNALWYASARGAALAGHSDSYGRSAGAVASSPSAPLVGAATVSRNNAKSDLYMAEIQLGVEWNYALSSLPAYFFVRTGYEYQDWNLVGPPHGRCGIRRNHRRTDHQQLRVRWPRQHAAARSLVRNGTHLVARFRWAVERMLCGQLSAGWQMIARPLTTKRHATGTDRAVTGHAE